jgi:hypothetical protein
VFHLFSLAKKILSIQVYFFAFDAFRPEFSSFFGLSISSANFSNFCMGFFAQRTEKVK